MSAGTGMGPLAAARRWLAGSMLRKSLAAVALPMLLLVVAVVAIGRLEQQTARAEQDVRRTLQVLSDLHEAHSLLAETAAALRGYRLVRRDAFLDPYRLAEPRLQELLDRLQREITDPVQAARMARVRPLFEEKMQGWRELLAPDLQPDAERRQLIQGKAKLDILRAELRAMREYETSQLERRTRTAQLLRQRNLVITQIATVLAGLGAVAAVMWFTSGLARRARRLAMDASRLGEGEALAPDAHGNDELAQVAMRLADASRLLAERAAETRRAREDAEAANQAKTEFLSRSSHELRTPLNAILGYAQVLEEDLAGRDGHRYAQRIVSAGRHLLGLISELLDIARIEAGRLDLAPEAVDLPTVLGEAVALVQPNADARGVSIAVHADAATVEADPQRLRQVLVNLLSNAIKFNREQGRVEVVSSVAAGRVRIEVRDEGPGVPPERRARLFVPFERLGAERSAVEGTGLGLAVSKHLVEAMGGEVGFDDAPGGGACVWLALPLSSRAPAAAHEAAPARDRAAQTPRHVLSVEDNPSNQALIETLLSRRAGWHLRHADTLAAAREALAAEAPDLVLLDLHLPDGRGEQLIAHMRASGRWARIPVVAVTADATDATLAAARAAGADEVITKPIDVARFHATLARLLA
ncbi:ATP-binding protein [Lysobacter brunescens]|uniref:histidine kinase n=1 Tax=Lysobacter brunescens TaxID=262323 RepID=A0ABW2Y888_9GAMM